MLKGMKILVTGGAGFIGSNLVDALIGEGSQVVIIDNLSTGKKENVNPQAKLIEADVSDEKKLQEIFKKEKPQSVFHMAAQIDINKSTRDPIWDAKQNILGSINLLENCRDFGVKKIIFSSSAGVYGDTDNVPTIEDDLLRPPSPYGIGKLAVEHYLEYYYKTYGLPYVTLRYANAYGPRQISNGEGAVVAIFCDFLARGEKPRIDGDGEQTRDYIYVSDIVKANILALKSDKTGIYNIGTEVETSVNKLAETVKKALASDVEFIKGPARKVDQRRSALQASRAKQDFNWEAQVGLEEGIKKTINWIKQK